MTAGLMGLVENPHHVLRGGTELLTSIPHQGASDLRSGATTEGAPDSPPDPGAGRAVQGGRSPAHSAAEGALDRSARPAHSTSGRPRSLLPTATEWGTKSRPGRFHEASSGLPNRELLDRVHAFFGDRLREQYDRLLSSLTAESYGYLRSALASGDFNENDRRRWWLLLAVLRRYADHPDLPAGVRPWLDSPEWR